MSADNGIYIHKFKDGWAVIEAQCIENIFSSKRVGYNQRVLKQYFKNAVRWDTQAEAFEEAQMLYKKTIEEFGVVEYGIRVV